MPLTNFGSILGFAEEFETQDREFYAAVIKNSACSEQWDLFDQFVRDTQKNILNIQRTRRENVTEMILEQISDFTRDPFIETWEGADTMSANQTIETAIRLGKRAVSYYEQAAVKLKGLSEVSRAMKMLGKKHSAHLKKLEAIGDADEY